MSLHYVRELLRAGKDSYRNWGMQEENSWSWRKKVEVEQNTNEKTKITFRVRYREEFTSQKLNETLYVWSGCIGVESVPIRNPVIRFWIQISCFKAGQVSHTSLIAFGFLIFPYIEADSKTKSFRNDRRKVRENKIRRWCLKGSLEINT